MDVEDEDGTRREVATGRQLENQEDGMTDAAPGPTISHDQWGSRHAKRIGEGSGTGATEGSTRVNMTGKYNKRR